MNVRWRRVLGLALFAFLIIPAVEAASGDPGKVSEVTPGKMLVIDLHKGMGDKVKGAFVKSDGEGVTLLLKNGEQRTVPWESIRNMKPKRKWTGFWLGMATGAAAAGAAIVGADTVSNAGWKAAFIGISAGSVGAFGATMDVKRQPPIYQAPKEESVSTPAAR